MKRIELKNGLTFFLDALSLEEIEEHIDYLEIIIEEKEEEIEEIKEEKENLKANKEVMVRNLAAQMQINADLEAENQKKETNLNALRSQIKSLTKYNN